MSRFLAALLGALAISLAGCVPSVYPLYTAKDLVFDPALIGAWQEDDEDDSWTFTKLDDTSYRLVVKEGDKTAPFDAHLVRLGAYRFLDMSPHEDGLPKGQVPDLYRMSLIAGHMFLKVSQIEPALQMAFLDPDWLDKRLSARPAEIAHIRPGDNNVVLTAPTPDLQRFVSQHAGDKGAFGESSNMKKKR